VPQTHCTDVKAWGFRAIVCETRTQPTETSKYRQAEQRCQVSSVVRERSDGWPRQIVASERPSGRPRSDTFSWYLKGMRNCEHVSICIPCPTLRAPVSIVVPPSEGKRSRGRSDCGDGGCKADSDCGRQLRVAGLKGSSFAMHVVGCLLEKFGTGSVRRSALLDRQEGSLDQRSQRCVFGAAAPTVHGRFEHRTRACLGWSWVSS
jgi:hypothetical protein